MLCCTVAVASCVSVWCAVDSAVEVTCCGLFVRCRQLCPALYRSVPLCATLYCHILLVFTLCTAAQSAVQNLLCRWCARLLSLWVASMRAPTMMHTSTWLTTTATKGTSTRQSRSPTTCHHSRYVGGARMLNKSDQSAIHEPQDWRSTLSGSVWLRKSYLGLSGSALRC